MNPHDRIRIALEDLRREAVRQPATIENQTFSIIRMSTLDAIVSEIANAAQVLAIEETP